MKQLIAHLLRSNRDEVVAKSLLNCHVKGLHSVMLLDSPGKTIRLYVTDKGHELYKNYGEANSLSLHAHHCELTLHCVYGEFTNLIMREVLDCHDNKCCEYNRWLYTSKISTGKDMGFVLDGSDYLRPMSWVSYHTGDSVYMKASDIHTVACPAHTTNAWLVYEGKEHSAYKPYAWSNNDLSNVSSEGLYQAATYEDIVGLLKSVNLI